MCGTSSITIILPKLPLSTSLFFPPKRNPRSEKKIPTSSPSSPSPPSSSLAHRPSPSPTLFLISSSLFLALFDNHHTPLSPPSSLPTATTPHLHLPPLSLKPKPKPKPSLTLLLLLQLQLRHRHHLLRQPRPQSRHPLRPPFPPRRLRPPTPFDELPPETEDEVAAAYEELYGTAYSGVTVLGNAVFAMDAKVKKGGGTSGLGRKKREKLMDGFDERVVQVRRVTKVVKGGKKQSFRAIVVVGDKKGLVGVGVGKAKEVADAIAKSSTNARRNIIAVPLTKYSTFPHR